MMRWWFRARVSGKAHAAGASLSDCALGVAVSHVASCLSLTVADSGKEIVPAWTGGSHSMQALLR